MDSPIEVRHCPFNSIVRKGVSSKDQRQKEVSTLHNRALVGLCFHPDNPNFICVMQESGDIHVVDATNGNVAHEYVAKAKVNSNWAVDKDNLRIFIVGDVGRACLFDISLSATVQVIKS